MKLDFWVIISLVIAIIFLCLNPADAAQHELSWDHSGNDDLAGFKIYRIISAEEPDTAEFQALKESGAVVKDVPADDRTCTVEADEDGTYWYRATAYDAAGNESDFSNVAVATLDTIAPPPPENLSILQRLVRWLRSIWRNA